ncbi:MAG: L-2-hydroxyglutarate oxidase [Planctomycetota bacterium]
MSALRVQVAVIGGGIVGLATAMALTKHLRGESPAEPWEQSSGAVRGAVGKTATSATRARIVAGEARTSVPVAVYEAESEVAAHQTGNNSGVIHSGLYYRPGSLKARNCVAGRELLYDFCREYGVPHENCGKVVVATRPGEVERLKALRQRGRDNGLRGITWLDADALREHEPHVRGLAGLHIPQTGIVDYRAVASAFANRVTEAGGIVQTNAKVSRVNRLPEGRGFLLETTSAEVECSILVNCAGLQSDRVARMCGVQPDVRIVPFRGEYYVLRPEKRHLVRNLIYPVPDPRFPFLGVHFTRMINGDVEAGPNAVLAFRREGYCRTSFSLRDTAATFSSPAFWRLSMMHWQTGMGEFYRSMSKRAFVQSLRRLIPDLSLHDVLPGGAGVRAQAMDRSGRLVDDFRIMEDERMIHVLNAPSPAATSSINIGRTVAELAMKQSHLIRP